MIRRKFGCSICVWLSTDFLCFLPSFQSGMTYTPVHAGQIIIPKSTFLSATLKLLSPQRILLLISFVAFICLNRLHSLNRDSVVVGKHLFAVLCVLNWTTMYYPPPSHKIVKKSGRRNEVASHSFLFSLSVSLVSSGSTYKASKLPVLRHHQTRKTCDIQWRWKNPERKEQQPLPVKKQPTTQCIPRRTPRLAYNRIPFNLAPPFSLGGLPKCWDYFRHSGQNTPLLGFCSKNIYSSYSSFTVQRPLRW